MEKLVAKARRSDGLEVRWLDESRFQAELFTIMAIFNDAWLGNWNFIPFQESEILHMAKALKPIIEPGYVAIAELDGKPAAMAVALPNINEAIADLDGRLLPFGWARLLWRLKVNHPTTARIALMGVRRDYQGTPLGAALGFAVIDKLRLYLLARGIKQAELSWVLEDNTPMRNMIELLGARPSKIYRVYEKALA